jgi:hypothetical protein
VLVNGEIVNSTHKLLKPGDIIEPKPGSMHIFKRMMARRLANNTFVMLKEGPAPQPPQLKPVSTRAVEADFGALLRDGEAVAESYRRLPMPKGAATRAVAGAAGSRSAGGTEAARGTYWPAARQAQLDAIVPGLLAGLGGDGSRLAGEMGKRRGELSVVMPPATGGGGSKPATLAWRPEVGEATARALLTLDRVALRKLLLGLLALRPQTSRGGGAQ